MNEEIHRLRAIDQEADKLYDTWRKHLEHFGGRQDYWDRIIRMADDFDRKHDTPLCRHYAGTIIAARVSVLEDEWRKMKK